MNKVIIILVLFLLLVGGVVFYQLNQMSQIMKTNGKVTLGNKLIDVEVVKTDKDRQVGLTKYKSLKETQGMLFVFEESETPGFWMKNMTFPIDMMFIKDDTVVYLVENAEPVATGKEPTVYKANSPANYVLEVQSGLVKKYNIKMGDKVKIEI